MLKKRTLGVLALLLVGGADPRAQVTGTRAGGPTGLSAFNPEIGVIADVVGRLSEEEPEDPFGEDEGIDRFSFREAEVVFGAFVDPFTRADFAFVFSDSEEAEIEEAFISFLGIPGRIRARVGKFRSKIGKMNLKDLNALPFVTEPLVIQEYLGEEGMALTGAHVSRLFGAGPLSLEVSGELLEGGQDVLFSGVRGEPIWVGHFRGFVDFTPRANFEVGLNYARGRRHANPGFDPDLFDPECDTVLVPGCDEIVLRRAEIRGVDLSYRWKRSVAAAVAVTAEAYRVERKRQSADPPAPDVDGGFVHADVRFAPRWSAGARYDRVEPLDQDPALPHDDRAGYAVYATYHLSEFAHIRLQHQLTREQDGFRNDEFFLQFRAQIGVDRHGLQ